MLEKNKYVIIFTRTLVLGLKLQNGPLVARNRKLLTLEYSQEQVR